MINAPNFNFSPGRIAVCYAGLSIITSIASSLHEGTFLIQKSSKPQEFLPFLMNFSTLVDFLILNPLVIFFLLKGFYQKREVYKSLKKPDPISSYHYIGLAVICLAIAINLLWLYIKEFLGGDHYDALIWPVDGSNPTITITGWISFFWTAIFMFILLFFSIQQFFYTAFILALRPKEITYQPHHEDNSGGQKILMVPILNFFYAMFGVLLIFVVFAIYDYVVLDIDESKRMLAFIIYVLIAIPSLLLPTLHIHKLMLANRNDQLMHIKKRAHNLYTGTLDKKNEDGTIDIDSDIKTFEYIEKFYFLKDRYPTWPLPRKDISFPIFTIIGALFGILKDALPYITKIL